MASRRTGKAADAFERRALNVQDADGILFGALDPGVTRLKLDELRLDGGTQPRAQLDPQTIAEYAEAMREGAEFPPVDAFYDGQEYWLADGFHRHAAAARAQLADVLTKVRQGTRRDAVLFSVGVNATHGLRRSDADKRRAVETLLNDEQWQQWSDREIARRCAVSHPFVGKMRELIEGKRQSSLETLPVTRTFYDKHGNVSEMDVDAIREANESRAAKSAPVRYDDGPEFNQEPVGTFTNGNAEAANAAVPIFNQLRALLMDIQGLGAELLTIKGIRSFYALGEPALDGLDDMLEQTLDLLRGYINYRGDREIGLFEHLTDLQDKVRQMIQTGQPYD